MNNSIETDVLIIGAGLLGCFTARNCTRYNNLSVTVLEREEDVCRGISKANTGIIYSGYDNKPETEKIKLCIQANAEFDLLCEELDVVFKRCGSIMLAYGPKAEKTLRKKYEEGIKSGIKSISLISGAEAEALEPNIAKGVRLALMDTATGTVNPWELCIAAYENARENGARFDFNTEVKGIRREQGGFVIDTNSMQYRAGIVVNAAGLNSDIVREMLEQPKLRIIPSAADYIVLDSSENEFINRIIFHETEEGKGVTLVPSVDGNIIIGPTNRPVEKPEVNSNGFAVGSNGLQALKKMCDALVPGIRLDKQIRAFASLRPNPYDLELIDGEYKEKNKKNRHDISIIEENGLYSLIGIKTPGLTFSNVIGRIIAERISKGLDKTEANPSFNPYRKGICRLRDMTLEQRAALISSNPEYGEIVCSCMDVSRAEIKSAIAGGANSIEAIKRRTGIGMGRCQGSQCRKKILDILKELS